MNGFPVGIGEFRSSGESVLSPPVSIVVDLCAWVSHTVICRRLPQSPQASLAPFAACCCSTTGPAGTIGRALLPQLNGGQDASRFAASGRMDSGKNGPRYSFRPGKPGQVGTGAGTVCRRHILSPMRNHGIDHAPPAMGQGGDDLRSRQLFGRVPARGRKYLLSQGTVSNFHREQRRCFRKITWLPQRVVPGSRHQKIFGSKV